MILEHLSPLQQSPKCRSLLQFKLDLAKQLIGGFCGRKRYPGTPMALALPNLPGHQEVKFARRKRACTNCSNLRQKNSGRTPETALGCSCCGVNLCRSGCFLQYHTEKSYMITTILVLFYRLYICKCTLSRRYTHSPPSH